MQDMSEFFKDVPVVNPKPGESYVDAMRRLDGLTEKIQAAQDAVQPDRSMQGPIFVVGEVLEIRGGKFQVTRIEPGHLRLKSLPSYHATPS